ncbi:MAG TPA: peptidylprolyl isomerase [Gemmatimonadaceae bacterium]|nr:peptidylprolyl isomerase [Gemmatimonadaceae bacterium]
MRFAFTAALVALPAVGIAQQRPLTHTDSALVGRILLAEDRRDATDRSLAEGLRHADSRVRVLARRARARITDPRYAARDSLAPVATPRAWPEPAWRLRYRALAEKRADCVALRLALADEAWPVRLRAAGLLQPACGADSATVRTLSSWIDSLTPRVGPRNPGGVSWHAAAHGLVAIARLQPHAAATRVRRLATHDAWHVRVYAARAAAVLSDSQTLRTLARDADDNVQEAALEALAKLTGHADDEIHLAALAGNGAQAVRAAALALKGSPRDHARAVLEATLARWTWARGNESERDVRVALLDALGRPPASDRPRVPARELAPRAVALALGEDVRLRITMATTSGGGSFIVRLRGDVAPIMAARILALANAGYYDGLGWHRVEHDFVIQGGSPGENEYVGAASYLRDELGTVPHARGTVGMSTRGHDTGDAQWFVNLRDNLRLGRDYTVFAEVVEGMEVVDGVMEGDVIASIREL